MNGELFHYGILGMKWGVRKDGKSQGFQYGEGNSTVKYTKYDKQHPRYRSDSTALRNTVMDVDTSAWRNDRKSKEYQEMVNKSLDYYNKNIASLSKEEQKQILNDNRKFLKDLDLITIDQAKNTASVTNKIANEIYNSKKLDDIAQKINQSTDRQERKQLKNEYAKEMQRIGDSFTDEFREAVITDIGYSDMELGKLSMNEIGYGPSVDSIYRAMNTYDNITDLTETWVDSDSSMGMRWGERK